MILKEPSNKKIIEPPYLHKPFLAGKKMEEDERETLKRKFNSYIQAAKVKIGQGLYKEALEFYKKADGIHTSEKLVGKISKLAKFLEELESGESDAEEDENLYEETDGFKIYKECWDNLYPHQKVGVKWFWNLHKEKKGGILSDDMGLGKTIQVIAFLSGMFDQQLIKNAVVIMPKSLMPNWTKEFEKWAPGIRLGEFHGTKSKREKELDKIQRKNGVILTTYGTISTSYEQFTEHREQRFIWDYIILDEGHKIKNPNKTSKSVRAVPARHRFILTGTPVQNNLSELWSLVDFVTEGKLLGTKKTFKTEFENPIVRARERDASNYEKRVGNQIAETLRKMIDKHLLRRRKADVFGKAEDDKENDLNEGNIAASEMPDKADGVSLQKIDVKLSKKNDLIIWLFLSEIQLKIYKDFLQTDSVLEAMRSTKSPLAQLTMLKKIADHPRLLSSAVCETLGLSEDTRECEEVLINESSKLQFVLELVKNFKVDGHRTLIFSQSRKMLDIVDKVLTKQDVKLLRLDGRILDPAERQSLIDKYQRDSSYTCFLLTTQVGAVGLNLTAADRVIIFDPSWNPGNDAQAVDRAYRIGQNKDVIIYRLITCGTIEEKIYRKQLFKDAISKQTTGTVKNPLRYFARNQLRELFILGDTTTSATHGILKELNGETKCDPSVEKHLQFLKSLDIFGISDHMSVYSKESKNTEDADADEDRDYSTEIMQRVKRAHDLVTSEVNLCDQISSLSINQPFKPSKGDIRRYMPNFNKKREEQFQNAEFEVKSIVVPDSPTSPERNLSYNDQSQAIRTPEEITSHIKDDQDGQKQIISIEDSLTESPQSLCLKEEVVDDDSVTETQPFVDFDPGIITSPVYDDRQEILVRRSGGRFAHSSLSSESSHVERTAEVQGHQTPLKNGAITPHKLDEVMSGLPQDFIQDSFDESVCPASSSIADEFQFNTVAESESSLDKTSNASITSKPSPVAISNDESYVEVMDDMCSPMSNISEETKLPNKSLCHNLSSELSKSIPISDVSPVNNSFGSENSGHGSNSPVRRSMSSVSNPSPSRDLQRSAVGLIYGLTPNKEGTGNAIDQDSVSVEVVDMACSPLPQQEIENDVVHEVEREINSNMPTRTANSFVTEEDHRLSFGIPELGRNIGMGILQCSTPHQEKPAPPIEAGISAATDSKTHSAGNSVEDGYSESLFSNSTNNDGHYPKINNHSHTGSEKLRDSSNGIQRSSQYANSESLFSEGMDDRSKDGSLRHFHEGSKPLAIFHEQIPESFDENLQQEAGTMLSKEQINSNARRSLGSGAAEDIQSLATSKMDDQSLGVGTVEASSTIFKSHRESLRIIESDSDNDSNQLDEEDDSEIILKDKSLRVGRSNQIYNSLSHNDRSYCEEIPESDDAAGDDNDDDSVSSNEMNMVSLLSGNRSTNYGEVAESDLTSSNVTTGEGDDSQTDNSESDDEVLLRSRRSLRRSILSKPRSSILLTNLDENASSEMLCQSRGTIEFPLEETNDHSIEIGKNPMRQEEGSFLSEQEAPTQPHPAEPRSSILLPTLDEISANAMLCPSEGTIDTPAIETSDQSLENETNPAHQDERSFLSEQEAPTQPYALEQSSPPLYVWDKPFYRRVPDEEPRNCIQDLLAGESELAISDVKVLNSSPKEEHRSKEEKIANCPCGKHVSDKVIFRKCVCMLNEKERAQYRKHLKEAASHIKKEKEAKALDCYMEALKIADSDLKIQRTICLLAKKFQGR